MSRPISYLLYICIFAISIFGSRLYQRAAQGGASRQTRLLYALVVVVPVIAFQGLRYNVGTDYFSYADLSEGFGLGNATYISWYDNEPLYLLLSKFSYLASGGSKHFVFLVDAILMNILLFFAIRYFGNVASMPVMYFMYYFLCFPYFLNAERQGLAVVIVWLSFQFVLERRPVRFALCILIATLVHNTAVIGIILYPAYVVFARRGVRLLKVFAMACSLLVPILFGVAIGFMSSHVPIFAKYTKFLNQVGDTKVNVNWLYMAVMAAFLLLFFKTLCKSGVNRWWLMFLLAWQLSCYLLNYYIEYGFRMSYYFVFGLMYCYAFVTRHLRIRENAAIAHAFLMGAMFFHFTYKFYIQGNCEIFPYQTIFFGGT